MLWRNFSLSVSFLKASKVDTHGVKKPYPTPTRTLPNMLRANQRPKNTGSARRKANLRAALINFVLHLITETWIISSVDRFGLGAMTDKAGCVDLDYYIE